MNKTILLASAALAFAFTACNRQEAAVDPGANNVKTYTPNTSVMHNAGRLVGEGFSKSIAIDSANKMIGSYLSSVGYPYADTAVRSLAFNADTLRSYLGNPAITDVKFYLAHQLGWLNAATGNYGKNVGLQPGKLTIICVGLDNNGNVVRNHVDGVYEHAFPCPTTCGSSASDPYLQ
jgi:hypothetical protein